MDAKLPRSRPAPHKRASRPAPNLCFHFLSIKAIIETLVESGFLRIKQLSHKLNVSPKHVAHTITDDVKRTSKIKRQQDYQITIRSSQCPNYVETIVPYKVASNYCPIPRDITRCQTATREGGADYSELKHEARSIETRWPFPT